MNKCSSCNNLPNITIQGNTITISCNECARSYTINWPECTDDRNVLYKRIAELESTIEDYKMLLVRIDAAMTSNPKALSRIKTLLLRSDNPAQSHMTVRYSGIKPQLFEVS